MFIINLLKELKKNRLVRGSFYLFIGSMLVNIGNYTFNIIAARKLSASDYGTYTALLSLFIIIFVPAGTIQTIITRFVARFKGQDDFGKMRRLLWISTKPIFIFGIILFGLFSLASGMIANFLNVDRILIIFLGFSFFIVFLVPINRGILGGNSRFGALAFSNVSEVGVRIVVGYLFLKYGFGLKGLMLLVSVQGLVIYILTIPMIIKIFHHKVSKEVGIDREEIWRYIPLALGSALVISILLNIDVVLAKHYFNPEVAGQYAALATIGKIVVYVPGAIGMVLLPIVAEKQAKGERYENILYQAITLTAVLSGLVVLLFYIFPDKVITILYGTKYLQYAGYLGLYGLAMFFFAITNILISFYLSINHKGFIWLAVVGMALQIGLMMIMHDSIKEFILVNFIAMLTLTTLLVTYNILFSRNNVVKSRISQ